MSKTIGIHSGNKKLGTHISTFSRSYDTSCPNSCEHIDNGCYAERIERLFPSAKKSGTTSKKPKLPTKPPSKKWNPISLAFKNASPASARK